MLKLLHTPLLLMSFGIIHYANAQEVSVAKAYTVYVMQKGEPCTVVPNRKYFNIHNSLNLACKSISNQSNFGRG